MISTPEQTFGDRLRRLNDLLKKLEAANAVNAEIARAAQARADARMNRRAAYFGDGTQPGLATLVRRVRDILASMRGRKNSPS